MQISNEEVSRMLAFIPRERSGRSSTILTLDTAGSDTKAAHVEVSPSAQEIHQIRQYIDQLPDTRTDRVQELKAQIENGTYQVSGNDVADLIIRRALADNTAL